LYDIYGWSPSLRSGYILPIYMFFYLPHYIVHNVAHFRLRAHILRVGKVTWTRNTSLTSSKSCDLCNANHVQDEQHLLFHCTHPPLVSLRRTTSRFWYCCVISQWIYTVVPQRLGAWIYDRNSRSGKEVNAFCGSNPSPCFTNTTTSVTSERFCTQAIGHHLQCLHLCSSTPVCIQAWQHYCCIRRSCSLWMALAVSEAQQKDCQLRHTTLSLLSLSHSIKSTSWPRESCKWSNKRTGMASSFEQ